VLNEGHFANLGRNWLPWQRPLRNRKKLARIDNIHANTFHLVKKKIVKIGPVTVDPELALLNLKKRKKRKVKYIARSAGMLSGLNKYRYFELILTDVFKSSMCRRVKCQHS